MCYGNCDADGSACGAERRTGNRDQRASGAVHRVASHVIKALIGYVNEFAAAQILHYTEVNLQPGLKSFRFVTPVQRRDKRLPTCEVRRAKKLFEQN